jgi:hypothetical protein
MPTDELIHTCTNDGAVPYHRRLTEGCPRCDELLAFEEAENNPDLTTLHGRAVALSNALYDAQNGIPPRNPEPELLLNPWPSVVEGLYEGSPDWMRKACRAAYGKLPPGSRFERISEAAELIRRGDEYDDEYINDGTPTAEDLKLDISTYNLLLAELERQVAATS